MCAPRTRFLLNAAFLLVLASPARAGDQAPVAAADFCAPRTMTVPFEAARPARWNTWVSVTDLKDNFCNNVAIVELRSKAQKTREGDLLVTFKATTYTRSGHDKRARVTIEVVAGESSIGSTVIQRIDAEENKNARGGSILYLPLDRVSGQADPELRIALEVADD